MGRYTNSFILSIVGFGCLLALGMIKGLDVSIPIVSVVAAYVGSRSALKGTGMLAASRDPACDTASVIEKLRN